MSRSSSSVITNSSAIPRRAFLQRSAVATVATSSLVSSRARAFAPLPRNVREDQRVRDAHLATLADEAIMRQLAMTAVDAAKAAGATYAAAMLTRRVMQTYRSGRRHGYRGGFGDIRFPTGNPIGIMHVPTDDEHIALGIRVLMPGGWGFAATPYWSADEAARIARDATTQATANGRAMAREIDWGQSPLAVGHWRTPIRIDPFAIPMEEKMDYFDACLARIHDHPWRSRDRGELRSPEDGMVMQFSRMEQTVVTSDGADFSQIRYVTGGVFGLELGISGGIDDFRLNQRSGTLGALAKGIDRAGAGWERIVDADLVGQVPRMVEEAQRSMGELSAPSKSVDVGRYEVVCASQVVSKLLDATVSTATQLDRALGWEANAGGTSYLSPDPIGQLGVFSYQSPKFTVTANRSQPRGLATMKWDDEGVETEDTTLIKDGVLADYQTTRESAAWLASYYKKTGRTTRSHGYAASETALGVSLQMTPNLVLQPSDGDTRMEDLIQTIKKGLLVTRAASDLDFQSRNGFLTQVRAQEIVNGRITKNVTGVGIMFETTQIWKNLIGIAGVKSAESYMYTSTKGEPTQSTEYTVTTVPVALQGVAVINARSRN